MKTLKSPYIVHTTTACERATLETDPPALVLPSEILTDAKLEPLN